MGVFMIRAILLRVYMGSLIFVNSRRADRPFDPGVAPYLRYIGGLELSRNQANLSVRAPCNHGKQEERVAPGYRRTAACVRWEIEIWKLPKNWGSQNRPQYNVITITSTPNKGLPNLWKQPFRVVPTKCLAWPHLLLATHLGGMSQETTCFLNLGVEA